MASPQEQVASQDEATQNVSASGHAGPALKTRRKLKPRQHPGFTHHAPARTIPAVTFKVSTVPDHVPHPPFVPRSNKQSQSSPAVQASSNAFGSGLPAYGTPTTNPAGVHSYHPDASNKDVRAQPVGQQPDLLPHHSASTAATISLSCKDPKPRVIRESASTPSGVMKPKAAPNNNYRNYSFSQKVQALTLLTHKYSQSYVEFITKVKPKAQARILKTAEERGFDFLKDPQILDAYVIDGQRTGRPKGSKTKHDKRWEKNGKAHPQPVNGQGRNDRAEEDTDEGDEEMDDSYLETCTSATGQMSSNTQAMHERHLEGITAQLAGLQEYLAGQR